LEKREFGERVFQARAALSCGIATMFANNQPRSVVSGEAIEAASFMREFSKAHFAAVVPIEAVRQIRGEHTRSARLISNIVVVLDQDIISVKGSSILDAILAMAEREDGGTVLESQFVSQQMVACLREGDFERFLELRTEKMIERIAGLVLDPRAGFGNPEISTIARGDESEGDGSSGFD
jgi:hypothetical protein